MFEMKVRMHRDTSQSWLNQGILDGCDRAEAPWTHVKLFGIILLINEYSMVANSSFIHSSSITYELNPTEQTQNTFGRDAIHTDRD